MQDSTRPPASLQGLLALNWLLLAVILGLSRIDQADSGLCLPKWSLFVVLSELHSLLQFSTCCCSAFLERRLCCLALLYQLGSVVVGDVLSTPPPLS